MGPSLGIYAMAAMYILAGFMHFIFPKPYVRIMPKYLPYPKALVFWSGVAEVGLGLALCFSSTRKWAVWGIISMLAIFLIVHLNMLKGKKEAMGIPRWILLLRIPLQLVFMYWAYGYL